MVGGQVGYHLHHHQYPHIIIIITIICTLAVQVIFFGSDIICGERSLNNENAVLCYCRVSHLILFLYSDPTLLICIQFPSQVAATSKKTEDSK